MSKPITTRTFGPIHFEDLDPHRFEDLIRQLIYDFKDWQSIEATGRGGGDDGFDIRAYEKAEIVLSSENHEDEETLNTHPMDGNLWMIQGKREKDISPSKIKAILDDVESKNPPYGYILAASTNFSKKSYDLFRQELRARGVMEFYIWGKSELEDMLYLPKNDRILFTFFGYSLISKRRSRATEIRSAIVIKNKLYRAIGEGPELTSSLLIRDLNDVNYPYERLYNDFNLFPRWNDFIAYYHHVLGLLFHVQEHFAYIDAEKMEWDYTDAVDLIYHKRVVDDDELQKNKAEKISLVRDFYDFLPRNKQGHYVSIGLIKYSDIAVIDEKGDALYNFPHIYVDYQGHRGPFSRIINRLKFQKEELELTEDFKRIDIFPKTFEKNIINSIIHDKKIELNEASLKDFKDFRLNTIFQKDDRYEFLQPRDVIQIYTQENENEDNYIQITHKEKSLSRDYADQSPEPYLISRSINKQVGNTLETNELINIYEFKRIQKWMLDKV